MVFHPVEAQLSGIWVNHPAWAVEAFVEPALLQKFE